MEKPKFVYVTYINTTPKKLWTAITKPEFARQYWGGNSNVSDWKEGSEWKHVAEGNAEDACCTCGEVLESKPFERLVLTWLDPENPADSSRVTLEIEQVKKMVKLSVVHGDFKPGSTMAGKVSMGWPLVLSSLKSFLETGKGIDIWAVKFKK